MLQVWITTDALAAPSAVRGISDKYFFVDVRDETILHRDRVWISRKS